MLNIDRAAGYARQRGIQVTVGDVEDAGWIRNLVPHLTGPQCRCIIHKAGSEHEHEQGVRCPECKPEPAAQPPPAWRKAEQELLDQL